MLLYGRVQAAHDTSPSKLVAGLLDAAIREELPTLLLDFKSEV